ncbi:MAG: hypothetical protein AB7H77_02205 [Bdellovibrionales bacterium]
MLSPGKLMGIAAVIFTLAGCSHAAPAQIVNIGDGARGWRITCGGWFLGSGDCYDKASYQCQGRGYTILKETNITPPDSSYFWNTASSHELIVKCNTGY